MGAESPTIPRNCEFSGEKWWEQKNECLFYIYILELDMLCNGNEMMNDIAIAVNGLDISLAQKMSESFWWQSH